MNANASTFVPSTFLSAKEDKEGEEDVNEEENEDIYFAIDVECVATGYTHNDRAVAQIAVVDDAMRTLVNVFVNSNNTNNTQRRRKEEGTASTSYDDENENDTNIVSTIEPLTGITREKLEKEGIPFADAMVLVRRCLPSRKAILVGQNVSKDIEWLGLREGEDFKGVVDLCGVWRTWNPKFKTYSVFSQDHLVRRLLKGQLELSEKHCAEGDSVKSMKLFQLWRELHHEPEKLQREKEKLLEGAPEPSFAKRFPTFEGVCMGNRKTCTCGAPFFG